MMHNNNVTMITCIDNIEWEDFLDNISHNRVGDNELSHQSRATVNPTSSSAKWREKTPRHRKQEYSHKNWSTSPGVTSRYGHRRVGDRERHDNKQNYWEIPLHSHREVRQQEYSQSNCSQRWHRTLHRQNGMVTSTGKNGTSEWKTGKPTSKIQQCTTSPMENQGRTARTTTSSN